MLGRTAGGLDGPDHDTQARQLRGRFEVTLNTLAESPLIGRTNEEIDD